MNPGIQQSHNRGSAQHLGAYVFAGPVPPGTLFADLDADSVIRGETAMEAAGYAVAGGQDLDADGFEDLILGTPDETTAGSIFGCYYGFPYFSGTGGAYLVYGTVL